LGFGTSAADFHRDDVAMGAVQSVTNTESRRDADTDSARGSALGRGGIPERTGNN
jgi:hypothetical protein